MGVSTQHGFFLTWSAIHVVTVSLRTRRLARYSFSLESSADADEEPFSTVFTGLATGAGCFVWLRNENRPVAGASFFENPANPAKALGLSCCQDFYNSLINLFCFIFIYYHDEIMFKLVNIMEMLTYGLVRNRFNKAIWEIVVTFLEIISVCDTNLIDVIK